MAPGVATVVGADGDAVYWSVTQPNTTKLVFGSSVEELPRTGTQLGVSSGPVVQVGDHVVFATAKTVVRASIATAESSIAASTAGAVGESPDGAFVWFVDGQIQWGAKAMEGSTMTRLSRANAIVASAARTYVAGTIGTSTDWRLLRLDRGGDRAVIVAGSMELAEKFPGGSVAMSSYRGRLVGADDAGALWLVSETAEDESIPTRAILVSVPVEGEPSVLLDRIGAVTAFFATPERFYWQEGDAVLSAPTSGGAASLEAHIAGQAGAVADGFVYYVNGAAIERLAVD